MIVFRTAGLVVKTGRHTRFPARCWVAQDGHRYVMAWAELNKKEVLGIRGVPGRILATACLGGCMRLLNPRATKSSSPVSNGIS